MKDATSIISDAMKAGKSAEDIKKALEAEGCLAAGGEDEGVIEEDGGVPDPPDASMPEEDGGPAGYKDALMGAAKSNLDKFKGGPPAPPAK